MSDPSTDEQHLRLELAFLFDAAVANSVYPNPEIEASLAELRALVVSMPSDFILDVEPAYLLDDWGTVRDLASRERLQLYACSMALGDDSHDLAAELAGELHMGLPQVVEALWRGRWRAVEYIDGEMTKFRKEVKAIDFQQRMSGRINSKGRLDRKVSTSIEELYPDGGKRIANVFLESGAEERYQVSWETVGPWLKPGEREVLVLRSRGLIDSRKGGSSWRTLDRKMPRLAAEIKRLGDRNFVSPRALSQASITFYLEKLDDPRFRVWQHKDPDDTEGREK